MTSLTPRLKSGFDSFEVKSIQPINSDLPDLSKGFKNDLTNPTERWNRDIEQKPESVMLQITQIRSNQRELQERHAM